MDNEKFQNKYRIPTARASWHDYSGGAYFISVCTGKHEHFFGEIVHNNGEAQMQLSTMGQLLYENLQNATVHYPYAEIPLFVVMPNHWHAIIFIDGNKTPYQRRNVERHIADTVETGRAPSLQSDTPLINKKMRQTDMLKGWLSIVVGGIKSAVTKFANENGIEFAWQTRFHDNIIRNQTAMNNIANYIENNVDTWETDCFNKTLS